MWICLAIIFVGVGIALQGCGEAGGGSNGTSTSTSTITTTTTLPSPFQKYLNDYPDACKPWLSRSNCSKEQYKGLVFFLHGYSACAIQVEGFAPLLNNQCLDVAAPTFPGHGKKPIHDCNAAGGKCTA